MTSLIGWLKDILRKLYLLDRPVVQRSKKDRRHNDRRWQGAEGDKPKAAADPRRRKERRKTRRRG
ncbi:MAG TPA: hypothetical protein VHE12_06705 [bacterium]|nr:hypothetical protein [bacterium]